MRNYNKIEEIAGTHLGKKGGEGYSNQYDPSLLVAIPRKLNRDDHTIDENNLPFVGYDVWNAYEVSCLTQKGLPVNGVVKIIYPSDSKFHVESKSLKLYLNSFNMTKLGDNTTNCQSSVVNTVIQDLNTLLQCPVHVEFFLSNYTQELVTPNNWQDSYKNVSTFIDLENIKFNQNLHTLQNGKRLGKNTRYKFKTDLLRSNCRVTFQPDWADLFVQIQTDLSFNFKSFIQYIVSHRKINHFHEEVIEMIYKDLLDTYKPKELMVCGLFTRRGGIDINPLRSTSYSIIPETLIEVGKVHLKTLRQ